MWALFLAFVDNIFIATTVELLVLKAVMNGMFFSHEAKRWNVVSSSLLHLEHNGEAANFRFCVVLYILRLALCSLYILMMFFELKMFLDAVESFFVLIRMENCSLKAFWISFSVDEIWVFLLAFNDFEAFDVSLDEVLGVG